MKGIGCLEVIFTDMNSVQHNGLNPYAAGTQVNTYHNGRWEDRTPVQQIKWTSARTGVSGGRQDCDVRSDVPKTEIMKSSQNSRSCKIRSRSGQISKRLERPRIDEL